MNLIIRLDTVPQGWHNERQPNGTTATQEADPSALPLIRRCPDLAPAAQESKAETVP